jgi:hypothetical protein
LCLFPLPSPVSLTSPSSSSIPLFLISVSSLFHHPSLFPYP